MEFVHCLFSLLGILVLENKNEDKQVNEQATDSLDYIYKTVMNRNTILNESNLDCNAERGVVVHACVLHYVA